MQFQVIRSNGTQIIVEAKSYHHTGELHSLIEFVDKNHKVVASFNADHVKSIAGSAEWVVPATPS